LFVGIDSGNRLAATGILWHVHDRTWEVLFTGSLSWKDQTARGNLRSHKIIIQGPHFVFVRDSKHMDKKISWGDVSKFPARDFFNYGDPGSEVDPTILARESGLVKRFLLKKQSKCWSEVRLVAQVRKRTVAAVCAPQPQPKSSVHLPVKRSRRIIENQKKTLFRQQIHHKQMKKLEKEQAVKANKLAVQQKRRDLRKIINEELIGFAYAKIRDKMNKMVNPKLTSINNKIKKLHKEISTLPDIVQQVDDLRQEVTEKIDSTRDHYDSILQDLQTNVDRSVMELAAKFKKKCRKLAQDVEKASKQVVLLGDRVNQIGKHNQKKRKRGRRSDKSGKKVKPQMLQEVKAEAQPNPAVVHRPPTPMVPPRIEGQGQPWFHVNDPQIVRQQTFLNSGSTVPSRRVSPTPQFISPVYAARNYIR